MTTYTDNAVAMQNGEEPLGQGCDASFQEAPATTMNQTGENVGVRSLGIDDAIGFEGDTSDREKCKIAKKPLYYRIIKRVFDIVFSLVVMVVAFIPLLILSVFIAFDTKAFPIYSQERIGQHGPFKFYKLRSMVKDSDDVEKHFTPEQLDQWNKEHKVDNDPRVTKLGAFLRKMSLDELPQFINVAAGQLSVIGPRCITESELAWYGNDVDLLLSVPQGITGAWQIGERNNATFENGTRQDIELNYCRSASLVLDIQIFFATFAAMFVDRTGR